MQNQTNNKSVCQQQAWSWMACAGTSFKRPTQIEDHLQCLLVTTSAKVRTTPTQQHVVHDYNVRVSPAGEVACCPTVCCLSTCFRKTLVHHDPRSILSHLMDASSLFVILSRFNLSRKTSCPWEMLRSFAQPRSSCDDANEQHGSAFDLKSNTFNLK